MSQADAWRYRPLASELRNARYNLRPQWDSFLRNEGREQTRVRDAYTEWASRMERESRARYANRLERERNRSSRARTDEDGRGWDPYGAIRGGLTFALPQAVWQTWGLDKSDVARSGRPTVPEYSAGTYDARDVPFGGSSGRRARDPKNWNHGDQPWPIDGAGEGAGGGGGNKHFNSTVRYERY